MSNQFASEGFDLDAIASDDKGGNSGGGDVIFEIGGGATSVPSPLPSSRSKADDNEQVAAATNDSNKEEEEDDCTQIADDYKARGNEAYKEKNWLEAMDMYTAGIESLPGMTATELLKLRDDWEKEQQKNVRQKLAEEEEERRRRRHRNRGDDDDTKKEEEDAGEGENKQEPERFRAPHHVHASRLAILHANRAAALLQLPMITDEQLEYALRDVDAAILWNPTYTKAYMRRATIYEKMEPSSNTEAALADAKMALTLDPNNRSIRAAVDRYQTLENERLEKLKTETMVRTNVPTTT